MRTTLALTLTLSMGLLPAPAKAQSMSDNYPPAPHGATQATAFAPFGPFIGSEPAGRHRGSASRACLTAQTRAVLAQFEGRFGAVKVISTCRAGAVIAGTRRPSLHRYGRAVDFMPNPGQRAAMIAWLRAHAGGSVLTYRSGHVHFDTGRSSRVANIESSARRARSAYARWR